VNDKQRKVLAVTIGVAAIPLAMFLMNTNDEEYLATAFLIFAVGAAVFVRQGRKE